VKSINETLRARCKVNNKCYLIDLEKVAKDLDDGKTVHVDSANRDIDLYQARPDGVHLSNLGAKAKAVAERMIDFFDKSPPSCGPGGGNPWQPESSETNSADPR
jgi:hypothetical protein